MKYNLELIRLIAVILITFTHTRHEFTEGYFHFFIEEIPQYGTVILSIVSGYLYWKITRSKPKLFAKKVKTLLIPFFIANLLVLIPVLASYFLFDYNFLNRLEFNYTIITEGLLALHNPPINPPTYFIRDIFIVFVLVEFLLRKNVNMLLILIPLFLFGEIMIRYDIMILFVIGVLTAAYGKKINRYLLIFAPLLLFTIAIFYFPDYAKYFISFSIFIMLVDLNLKFFNTGGYSYLLHLYHSPIIVLSFPIISLYVKNEYLLFFLQVGIAMAVVYLLFLLTRRFKFLQIMSGRR